LLDGARKSMKSVQKSASTFHLRASGTTPLSSLPSLPPSSRMFAAVVARQDHHHQLLASAAHSITPSEASPSFHDHGVEDALGVIAMARQHVRNKSYQVGAVVRQGLGDMVVVVPVRGSWGLSIAMVVLMCHTRILWICVGSAQAHENWLPS